MDGVTYVIFVSGGGALCGIFVAMGIIFRLLLKSNAPGHEETDDDKSKLVYKHMKYPVKYHAMYDDKAGIAHFDDGYML